MELYQAEVVKEYGEEVKEPAVVVITDGARNLKKEAKKIIGSGRMEKENDVNGQILVIF